MWITETEAERDAEGNEIPNSSRRCYVEMDFPPGLSETDKRSRDAILRACRKAVYEDGLSEYGNKQLVVIGVGDQFSNPFERVSVTKLLPPDKAERVRSGDLKGMSFVEDTESVVYDDEDSSYPYDDEHSS